MNDIELTTKRINSKVNRLQERVKELLAMRDFARIQIRKAVADYMESEGCSCCRDIEGHAEHTKRLAELLDVPMYKDGSGYDFRQFRSDASK